MSYVKNFFILAGLFILSQVSSTLYGVFQIMNVTSTIGVIFMALIIIINITLLVWIAKKLDLLQFKFSWATKKNFYLIILGTILMRVIAIIGTLLIQFQSGQETSTNDAFITDLFANANPVLLFLILAVSAPIMEEIVFRGVLMNVLFKKLPYIGIAASALCFGGIHLATDISNFLLYASMGLLLAIIYHKTQRLEVVIMIHFLNNLLPAIMMITMGA